MEIMRKIFSHRRENEISRRTIPTPDWFVWCISIFTFISILFYYKSWGAYDFYDSFSRRLKMSTILYNVFIVMVLFAEWEIGTKKCRKIKGIFTISFIYTCLIFYGGEMLIQEEMPFFIDLIVFLAMALLLMMISYDSDSLWNILVYFFNEKSVEEEEEELEELKELVKILDEYDEEIERLERLEAALYGYEEEKTKSNNTGDFTVLPNERDIIPFLKRLQDDYRLFNKAKIFGTGFNKSLQIRIGKIAEKAKYYEQKSSQFIEYYNNVEVLATYMYIAAHDYKEFDCFEVSKACRYMKEITDKGIKNDEVYNAIEEVKNKIEEI